MAGEKVVSLRDAKRRAAGAGETGGEGYDDGRPVIRVENGELPAAVDRTQDALAQRPGDLYHHANGIVRPVTIMVPATPGRDGKPRKTASVLLEPADTAHIGEVCALAAHYQKFDGRTQSWVRADPPKKLIEAFASRSAQPTLRPIRGVITAPTLKPDLTILSKPGYDEQTGLLYHAEDAPVIDLPARPSRDDALRASALLDELLQGFPFADRASKAVAKSQLLTAVARPALPTAPMHCVTATSVSSGKSYLADLASLIATGDVAAVIRQGRNEEEFEKQISAALLGAAPLIVLDNCDRPVGGDYISQILTQERVTIRIFGVLKNVIALSTSFVMANGNNLVLQGDVTRRAVICALDPESERPELTEFANDPAAMIRRERGKYLAACLVILRAFALAPDGYDADADIYPTPIASFVKWARLVRNALIWLGEDDPCETMAKLRQEDPRQMALEAILEHWGKIFADRAVVVRQIIQEGCLTTTITTPGGGDGGDDSRVHPGFFDALMLVADDGRGRVSPGKLGKWIKANAGRVVKGLRLTRDEKRQGQWTWRVTRATRPF